jgi:hypothetical protein
MKQAKPFIPPESPIIPKVNYPLKKQFTAIEHYEIYESQGNHIELTENEISKYHHREMKDKILEYTTNQLIVEIKEELGYQGFTIDELAKATYIDPNRLRTLLKGKTSFRKGESEAIKKKLHIN